MSNNTAENIQPKQKLSEAKEMMKIVIVGHVDHGKSIY